MTTMNGDPSQYPITAHSHENLAQEHQLPPSNNMNNPTTNLYGGSNQPTNATQCRSAIPPPHFGHVNPNLMHPVIVPPQPAQKPQPTPQQSGEEVNLHQKLRRQLSLNPTACDPRIYRNQHNNMKPPQNVSNLAVHRPLAPTLSGGIPRNQMSNQWDLHQVINLFTHIEIVDSKTNHAFLFA